MSYTAIRDMIATICEGWKSTQSEMNSYSRSSSNQNAVSTVWSNSTYQLSQTESTSSETMSTITSVSTVSERC